MTGFLNLVKDGIDRGQAASKKFPQPNYVALKIAEEGGEVMKAAVHLAEERDSPEHLRDEMIDLIAMLWRLYEEGDQVNGVPSLKALGY